MASANLFQQYLQPVRSVTDYAADLDKQESSQLALVGQRRQNELSALTADQTRRTMADAQDDRNALQRIAAGWGADTTVDQRVAALRNSGRPSLMTQADALEKQGLEKAKTGAEVSEKNSKVLDETIKRYRGSLDYIDTPQGAARWLQAQYTDPVVGPYMQAMAPFEQAVQRIPASGPEFEAWRQKAGIGMEKFLEQQLKKSTQDEVVRANKAREANAAGQLRVAQDNLGLRQQEVEQGKWQYDADRGGLVNLRTGEFKPATQGGQALGAKQKPPTEFQGKSALFGARAKEADRILSGLEKDGVTNTGITKSIVESTLGLVPFVGDKLADAGGSTMNIVPGALGGPSAKQQQVEQARRDFVNAVLRQESGAAIGQSEFINASKQYFPQPGDSAAVIKQKAANRRLAVQGLLTNAGGASVTAPPADIDFGSLK